MSTLVQTDILRFGDGTARPCDRNDPTPSTQCTSTCQCLTLPNNVWENGVDASSTNPATGSVRALHERLGQLTLSQDRCWVTIAGINAPAGTDLVSNVNGGSISGGYFSFAAISSTHATYWQANDKPRATLELRAANVTDEATVAASIPRAAALGRSAADDLSPSIAIGGSNPFIDTLFYITGETGAPSLYSLIWSSSFGSVAANQPMKYPVKLDATSRAGTTGLCFAADTSSPPAFYQHLLTVTAQTYGAIRYWGDYQRRANNPSTQTVCNFAGSSIYGRCGTTPTQTVPPEYQCWKCVDSNNQEHACDSGSVASLTYDATLYQTGKIASESNVPTCPVSASVSLVACAYNSGLPCLAGGVSGATPYKGQLVTPHAALTSSATTFTAKCFTVKADESKCAAPVTVSATSSSTSHVPDTCYKVFNPVSVAYVYLSESGGVNVGGQNIYCGLYAGSATMKPPQQSFTCNPAGASGACPAEGGGAPTYYPYSAALLALHTGGLSGVSSKYTYSAAYTCVPCWGGFDAQISPHLPNSATPPTDTLQSTTIASGFGQSGSDPAKLTNCAAAMPSATAGSASSYVFWAEVDAVAAVKRGSWANGVWGAAENIWPSALVAAGEMHVLGVAYLASSSQLFAVSPNKVYVSWVEPRARRV